MAARCGENQERGPRQGVTNLGVPGLGAPGLAVFETWGPPSGHSVFPVFPAAAHIARAWRIRVSEPASRVMECHPEVRS